LASDSVPEPYLDAWARLQCQHVTVEQWRQAVDDAGRFLDQWGSVAAEFHGRPAICLTCLAAGIISGGEPWELSWR
jgi:hypothetical protein